MRQLRHSGSAYPVYNGCLYIVQLFALSGRYQLFLRPASDAFPPDAWLAEKSLLRYHHHPSFRRSGCPVSGLRYGRRGSRGLPGGRTCRSFRINLLIISLGNQSGNIFTFLPDYGYRNLHRNLIVDSIQFFQQYPIGVDSSIVALSVSASQRISPAATKYPLPLSSTLAEYRFQLNSPVSASIPAVPCIAPHYQYSIVSFSIRIVLNLHSS